jgi:tetratricopeptide (TPR) repeat protein
MWVSGGPSATVHHNEHVSPPGDEDEAQHFVETLAAAHLLAIAGMLARFGTLGPAARVAATALEHGTVGDPQTAGDTVALLFDAGRFNDALDAVGTFLHRGNLGLADAALSATMWATGRLDKHELLLITDRLERWADEHDAAGDPANMAGTLTYNAANFSGQVDLARTLRLFDLAADRQPAYRARGYWHRERAGVLYHLGDHHASADAYQQAVDLGDERSVPLLADTLVLVGRYDDARTLLWRIDGSEHDQSEWVLKRHLLDHLIRSSGSLSRTDSQTTPIGSPKQPTIPPNLTTTRARRA